MQVVLCYPGGKHKALTMSYDDGKAADRRLVGCMNDNGIKGTFHINSGLFGEGDRLTAEEAAALYRGHEVSAHTLTHPTIARCSQEQIVHEISEDRKNLEAVCGYPIRGMSYPNGSFNRRIKELLPFLGIEYARVVQSTHGFALPDDWHEWRPTCHHKDNLLQLAEAFVQLHKKQYLYLMYVWGHSYEFDLDNNWDLIETFCKDVGGREDIWYATNMEIVDYMTAFQRLKFSAAQDFVYNPSCLSVWLSVGQRIVEVGGGTQVRLQGGAL